MAGIARISPAACGDDEEDLRQLLKLDPLLV